MLQSNVVFQKYLIPMSHSVIKIFKHIIYFKFVQFTLEHFNLQKTST